MERSTSSFQTRSDRRNYFILLIALLIIGVLASIGLLVYDNPVPPSSPSFLPVVNRRINALIAMLIAAVCQSLATVTFQTVTNNKVITPSLLGFDSLYSAIQTGTIYFFGASALIDFTGTNAFLIQIAIMIGVSLLLYGTLLTGEYADLDSLLLIGVVLGQGLKSLSAFMRRLLSPSEFDILQARLFASVNNADESYYPIAIPIILVIAIILLASSNRLNVLSLGKGVATNLGMNHNRELILALVIVSVLVSISTAVVGPMTFYGFLSAILAYQFTPTYDHKYIFPMTLAFAFVIITVAYFIMNHVFYAQGVVTILIEFVGGLVFLAVIMRRGDL